MGKAILYCFQCSTRLHEDDFPRGKAVRVGDHVACAACAPAPAAPAAKKQLTSTRIPAQRPGSSPAVPRPAPPPPDRRLLILAGSGALVVVLAVAAVFAFHDPPPPPAAKAGASPEPGPARPPVEGPDRAALDAARRWARENPKDLSGQLREYQNMVLEFDRAPSAAEAQKEILRLKSEIRGYVDAASAALESEIQPLLDRKDYAAALKAVEAAGKRLPYPDWELARSKREHEVRDLLRAKVEATPHQQSADADLVGHWTFDEGSGTEAKDRSGHGHTGKLRAGASWAPGVKGSGLRFDGKGGYVQLPNTPLLDKLQAGSFTLAAWYKPDVVPPGPPDANDSAHAILVKQGWHEGLVYNRESRFIVEHWLVGDVKATGGTWDDTYAPGKFYHFAGVVDRAQGKTILYVDGKFRSAATWTPGAATKDFGSQPWRIGIGAPGAPKWAYPAAGVIDDVRMYRRALTAEEIQSLCDSSR